MQIAALERSRKIEELQKRLVESEMLRTRYSRKLTIVKDQLRTATETADQERSINEHTLQLLRDELAQVKQNVVECTRRESQVCTKSLFRIINTTINIENGFEIFSIMEFFAITSCRPSVSQWLNYYRNQSVHQIMR